MADEVLAVKPEMAASAAEAASAPAAAASAPQVVSDDPNKLRPGETTEQMVARLTDAQKAPSFPNLMKLPSSVRKKVVQDLGEKRNDFLWDQLDRDQRAVVAGGDECGFMDKKFRRGLAFASKPKPGMQEELEDIATNLAVNKIAENTPSVGKAFGFFGTASSILNAAKGLNIVSDGYVDFCDKPADQQNALLHPSDTPRVPANKNATAEAKNEETNPLKKLGGILGF